MSKPYSRLRYRELTEAATNSAASAPAIIAIHGDRGGPDDVLPLARTLEMGGRIVAPEAARGVYSGLELVSRTWFGGTWQRPEPASFGDSLAQLERFVHDVGGWRGGAVAAPPLLLGVDQGASLALALAMIAPELITGVIAICGGVPTFSDPSLLMPVEARLPILVIGDAGRHSAVAPEITNTETRLARLGHQVSVRWIDAAPELDEPVTAVLRAWVGQTGIGRAAPV